MSCFLKELPDSILDSSIRNKHVYYVIDSVESNGEPLGYKLGLGVELMDYSHEFKYNLHNTIDNLNDNTIHICKKVTFVTVAWCITRPDLWCSIEAFVNINQFERVITNIWAKFLPDNQYYQYVILARTQGRYEDVTDLAKLGT